MKLFIWESEWLSNEFPGEIMVIAESIEEARELAIDKVVEKVESQVTNYEIDLTEYDPEDAKELEIMIRRGRKQVYNLNKREINKAKKDLAKKPSILDIPCVRLLEWSN